MKKVYIATNPITAHLVKGLLDSETIRSMVQGEFLWSAHGELPITPETCPSVWVVDDADFDRALKIINDFQSKEDTGERNTAEWTCRHCGESCEGQFTECWQCGASRY